MDPKDVPFISRSSLEPSAPGSRGGFEFGTGTGSATHAPESPTSSEQKARATDLFLRVR